MGLTTAEMIEITGGFWISAAATNAVFLGCGLVGKEVVQRCDRVRSVRIRCSWVGAALGTMDDRKSPGQAP